MSTANRATDNHPSSEPQSVSLIVRRTIQASAERLFEAWTQPRHLQAWWGPRGATCAGVEMDLRVGGRYRIANRMADGEIVWISGELEEIDPPHKLVYTWCLELEKEPSSRPRQERVTVRFEPRDGATEVIVVHERIADAASRDGHESGWHGCLEGLAAYLGSARGPLERGDEPSRR